MDAFPGYAWLDDRIVAADALWVSADDPGLTVGDGIFETMRVVRGEVQSLAAHLARFEATRAALALPRPATDPAHAIAQVLAQNDLSGRDDLGLRLTLTARPTLIVRLRALTPRDHQRRAGLALHTLPARRGEAFLARYKTLAWNANAVAQRLHTDGSDPSFEGLWLDPDGVVLEGTSTNLFAVLDGVVHTAPTSLPILPGVARARVLGALQALAIPHREVPFTRADLDRAEAIFATNALLPLAPVLTLDGQSLHKRRVPMPEGPKGRPSPSLEREPLHQIVLRAIVANPA